MKPPIQHPLPNIQRSDTCLFVDLFSAQDELVFPPPAKRKLKLAALENFCQNIVCVQYRSFSDSLEPFRSEAQDVGIRPNQNANVAVKRGDFSNRVRNIIVVEVFPSVKTDQWNRQESFQILSNSHRTGTWSPATVRSRESLVKIEMNDIESHVSRPNLPQYRVEVGTIIV